MLRWQAAASQQRSASPVRANPNADFNMADLERLDKMMVVVALLGMIVNVVQVFAISNHAWLKATAMADGQPFTAHLSLASARFGEGTSR